MRRRLLVQLLLQAMAVLFLNTSANILPSATTDQATTLKWTRPSSPFGDRRSLRKVDDTEERAGPISNALKYAQAQFWAELGKSDDYVKKVLHLNGLRGESLKTHKNYNFYKFFLKKNEDILLGKWFRHEITTTQAWREVGFQYITKAEQLHLIKNTDEFRAYKRYVNAFDKEVLLTMKMGDDPPRVIIARGASDAEITARMQIMAEAGRSDAYAKFVLGMTETFPPRNVLRGAAVEAHADFRYFLLFLREREPAMRDELARLEKLAKLSSRQRKAQREMLEDLQLIEKYRPRNGGAQ